MTGAAVVLALGFAVLAQEAPDARTVRVEAEDDARLAALVNAVRAELVAAGFMVLTPLEGSEPSGVVRLRMADDHCGVVTATAIVAGKVFQSLVGCEANPGTDRRAGDRVALQLAEWMDGAVWLPPPPDPAPPAVMRQVSDLAEPRPAIAARPSSFVDTVDVGTTLMRTPVLGTHCGGEAGASMRWRTRGVVGATPFARLSLAYEWMGTGVSDFVGEHFNTRYGTLSIAGGLSRRLGRNWAAEVNANFGVTLVWINADLWPSAPVPGVLYHVGDRVWEATPGAPSELSESCPVARRWRWERARPGSLPVSSSGLPTRTSATRTGRRSPSRSRCA